jgi:hypothetical protein
VRRHITLGGHFTSIYNIPISFLYNSILMNIDKIQMDYYNLTDTNTIPFKITKNEIYKLNIPKMISQLILILDFLLKDGYTLSYICPDDFVLKDKILFLNDTRHVVKIGDPIKISKKEDCFHSKGLKATVERTYASVGLFVYYLYTRKFKTSLKEEDYGKLVGTKAYYFIKNTQDSKPILFYL